MKQWMIQLLSEYELMGKSEYNELESFIQEAMLFAFIRHIHQTRKTTNKMVFVHLVEVMKILRVAGASIELQMAGLLHDVIEDTIDHEELGEEKAIRNAVGTLFGKEVLELVLSNTEDKHGTWEERKKHTHEQVRTATRDQKMLVVADKFSNLRSLATSYQEMGESVWNSFNRGKELQGWYFHGVCENAFVGLSSLDIPAYFFDYQKLISKIFA